MRPLEGQVAVVAGATRGAGRGIACALGEAGAAVYCTGRSVRGHPATANRPETIEETAEMVSARGGWGIPIRVDHTVPEEVQALFRRVADEAGRLDVLVNDVWGGDPLTEWGRSFWEHTLEKGLQMLRQAVHSHIITSHFAAPLMIERRSGLIVEITDGDQPRYRGNLFYDLVKTSTIRLAYAMAHELRPHGITALAVTPGFLRSEAMLDHFGVTEETWEEAVKQDVHFAHSETPLYVGRAVAALAADPQVWRKAGGVYASWTLGDEYGFTDTDGRRPHFGRYVAGELDRLWADLTERVWEEFQTRAQVPEPILDHDRRSLTLRARPAIGAEAAEWVRLDLTEPDLFFGDLNLLATGFRERYERAVVAGELVRV